MICPLISLMEDQLMVLEQLGISATLLNASSSKVCLTVKLSWLLRSVFQCLPSVCVIYEY